MRSIFITGGASGIGLAAAKRFSREGWIVGIGDIDEKGRRRAAEELNIMSFPLDVRDRVQWQSALEAFVGRTGRLDVLLNNAGIARYGMFEEVTPDESDLQIDINVKGVVNGAYSALPHLKATPGSRLVNVASVAGIVGSPGLAVYSATKHAVRGLTEALDAEWTRHGIDVTCVMPFFVETPILDAGSVGSNRTIRDSIGNSPVYTVDEAAEMVWQAAHGRDREYIVGKAGRQASFARRFMPGRLRKRLKAAFAS
ncbi:SDR family oxidoreductase [Sphingomonas sp.]|jgi:NAD(P)-dependent dehydrogenase (short-subunit alcohol dehydrogenase family)|uniref:SDR family oxidoreductase n=1 Tax=Sphingomonas sp. TaxID=28214 RepID=UPI002623D58C|nr:SDR family oxidoreductase [Sphingomonas sp.]MDF2495746.1 short-chain dehydrogenase [Sphingomonas sp.]